MCVSRHAIVEFVLQHPHVGEVTTEDILAFVAGTLKTVLSPADVETLTKLWSRLKAKWTSARRTKDVFLEQNQQFLNTEFCLSERVCRPASASSRTPRLRRPLPFQVKGHRSKLRATEDLLQEPSPQLAFAAASTIRREGRRKAAHILEVVASPRRGPRLSRRLAASERRRQPQPYTPEEALALLIDLGLSRAQYQRLRMEAKARGADITISQLQTCQHSQG